MKRPAIVTKRRINAVSSAAPAFGATFTGRRGARHYAPQHREPIDPGAAYFDLLEDLVKRNSGFAWACCPFHDDGNPSLCVNLETGWFRCFSSNCGETGSNIVAFVGRLLELEYVEARRYLESHYGN